MPYAFDDELAAMIPLLPTISSEDVLAARAELDALVAGMVGSVDTSDLDVTDRRIDGLEGDPAVPVRVYRARQAKGAVPGVLMIHGGGFTVGNLESEHMSAARLARTLEIVVVSVDYRLAPENPFPAALHDCSAALQWLHRSSDELGVDTSRLAVYGQSAGGGLAAALALFTRDHGGPPLCFQFLGIPELDDRLETASMRSFVDTPMWSLPAAELSWQRYLGAEHDGDVSPYAAPARATDLRGLPPAYVSTMEFDPLRDEGILYALAMLSAGVQVELHSFPGTFHGSALFPNAGISRRIADEEITVLRKALGLASSA
jgi:acetyl esterase/lipase